MKKGAMLLAIALLVMWLLFRVNPIESVEMLINELDDKATRGKKVSQSTPSTKEIRDGAPVNESPEELARQATDFVRTQYPEDWPADLEISPRLYTLARVARSERLSGGSNLEAIAIMQIVVNIANASYGGDIVAAATGGSGKYGRQRGNRPPVASSVDPYFRDLVLAGEVLAGTAPNLVGKARNFMHPKGFSTTAEYEAKKAAWIAKGLTPIKIEGCPQLEVFA